MFPLFQDQEIEFLTNAYKHLTPEGFGSNFTKFHFFKHAPRAPSPALSVCTKITNYLTRWELRWPERYLKLAGDLT